MTASRSAVPRPDAHVHFGVFFQGVNHTTIWSDSSSGSQIDFETFRRLVLTAERGLFDAFFLGEGLRLREQNGKILDLDIAGRPDAIAQLAALAGITDKIGLVATQNTTYNEPADLARRLSGLDLLSDGRAGWNAVTTDNAWTGENFRRGGFLDHSLRYERAGQFIETARALWDSWADDAISGSRTSENWSTPGAVSDVRRQTSQFDISVTPTLPRSRQGHPVIFQAGDSPSGRDFAATHADVIFSRHGTHFDGALDFADDIRARLRRVGRPEDDVKILPSTQIVLAESESEVEEKTRWVLEGQFTGQTALSLVGLVWGKDLSDRDPDDPLPEEDPVARPVSETRGSARDGNDPIAIAREWRALAEAKNLSLRQVAIETSQRSGFAGTPGQVADQLVHWVRNGASDGFNISPYLVPTGLDEIVDWLIPELQERGAYRTEYSTSTLREHLGLRPPLTRRAASEAAG
ncbi:NtaA/DmoA family FMN-dependent monooxygenase [Rhodococcus sp. IEGM 1318]|uniref:NtaA/DmoA family FMN-dependent monooxygenase n=1 Tax=Rhodococcus sp. IEGM 1318 TaxID=3082226 RepID=UPI0029552AEC|nr:NtaA/DmoA family FMN-dependent monooxygenase [Rhodococcus sp. IEGM 1318]MDV8008295.1 NtaA/DmoA family FMN-dependent monooxygenase [Rhodococcus sp. IEGM 1318]